MYCATAALIDHGRHYRWAAAGSAQHNYHQRQVYRRRLHAQKIGLKAMFCKRLLVGVLQGYTLSTVEKRGYIETLWRADKG